MESLWKEYCNWLLNLVGFVGDFRCSRVKYDAGPGHLRPKNYDILMSKLHDRDFYYIIESDESRMKDGLILRYDFFDDCDIIGGSFKNPCSVLEMLVGLAVRIDSEYIGDPGDPHPERFFWEMICNLGLNTLDNEHFNSDTFDRIIVTWLNREYDFDGKGSIFPLKSVTSDGFSDTKVTEIWQLAMAYITDNY